MSVIIIHSFSPIGSIMLPQAKTIVVLLCIFTLVITVDASSSRYERDQLFVELRTNSLTIPVPYRPEEDYSHGSSPLEMHQIPKVPLPKETDNNNAPTSVTVTSEAPLVSTPHHSSERTTEESTHVQDGRGLGRSMKKPQSKQESVLQEDFLSESSKNNLNSSSDGKESGGIRKIVMEDEKHFDEYVEDNYVETGYRSGGQQSRMLAQLSIGGKYVSEPDNDAQHGDPCTPTGALEWDYCEKAKYPNKARMVCATKDLNLENKEMEGTCVCKFAKYNQTGWRQLRYHPQSNVCRSPEGGMCYVKFPTPMISDTGGPVYSKNILKAHEQCDDDAAIVSFFLNR